MVLVVDPIVTERAALVAELAALTARNGELTAELAAARARIDALADEQLVAEHSRRWSLP